MSTQAKTGRPTDGKPDEWQQDLTPNPMAGQNTGIVAKESQGSARNAYQEIKKS